MWRVGFNCFCSSSCLAEQVNQAHIISWLEKYLSAYRLFWLLGGLEQIQVLRPVIHFQK